MTPEKQKSLNETYNTFMDLMLGDLPLDSINDLAVKDVTGYGSTVDEKINDINRLRQLVIDQREQSAGIEISIDAKPVHRRISPAEDSAIFTDEIEVTIKTDEGKNVLKLRLSIIFEFINERWKVVYMHGSTGVETDGDTWHIDEWKKKMEELQKLVDEKTAELQNKNRELEIEAALERVRARSMAMLHSRELVEVVRLLDKEIKGLGIQFVDATQIVTDFSNPEEGLNIWITVEGVDYLQKFHVPYFDHPTWFMLSEALKKGQNFYTEKYLKAEKNRYFRLLFKYSDFGRIPKERQTVLLHTPGLIKSYVIHKNSILLFQHNGLNEFNAEDNAIFRRFGAVFEQSYTRFLDLQKAEAQARESEIQLALERVRARTMAMQKSEDLSDAVKIVFDELDKLNLGMIRCGIGILNKEKRTADVYTTTISEGKNTMQVSGDESMDIHPMLQGAFNAWENNTDFLYVLEGDDLTNYYKSLLGVNFKLPESQSKITGNEGLKQYYYATQFQAGGLFAFRESPYPKESKIVLRRFADVFNLTYTRFNDLLQAEAQAREAQFEAALERVRSRSMGMHKSDELKDVVRLLYKEFRNLLKDIDSVNIQLNPDSSKDVYFWASVGEDIYPELYHLPYSDLPIFEKLYNAFNYPGEGFLDYLLNKEEKDAFFSCIFKIQPVPPNRKKMIQNAEGMAIIGWFHKHSGIDIVRYNLERFSEEQKEIVKRFAAAFEQTYIRFLDLQKAEKHAREAEIQLALERVRARTMAMHQSDELAETAAILFQQMKDLGVTPERINICLIKEADNILEVWATDQQGIKISHHFNASLDEPTTGKRVYDAWKEKKKSIVIDLSGKELNDWIRYVREVMGMTIKDELVKEHRIHSVAFFSQGMILTTTPEPLPKESIKLLERFADVFNLTYRRFLDLQKAEAQAREAIKQASLDRVRGEIASMRTTEDLNRITPIIWRELKTLEVPFIRCGVFIVNEDNEVTHVYLTTPEGKSLGVLNLPFDANSLTSNVVKFWRSKNLYREHWDEQGFINWTNSMMELGQVIDAETYQGSANPPESLDLHFVPFTQGMLYVGNSSPLSEESIELVQTLAEAFSIAYARYEDFNRVESAFKELNKLSNELQIKNGQLETENKRKAVELEEARELQLAMLPKQIPEHPGLDIKVYMQTATEVGGDYYDFSYHKNDDSINIAIGDATGHGMKAGTLVTMIKSLFVANSSDTDIQDFFISSNTAIKNANLKRMMVAFAMVNISANRLKVLNAGMPPVYYYRKNSGEIIELGGNNFPLGAMLKVKYKVDEIEMNHGDVVLMMSDGFPELHNENDELYGYERFVDTFTKIGTKSAIEIINTLKNKGSKWANNNVPDDDVTFVVIKVK